MRLRINCRFWKKALVTILQTGCYSKTITSSHFPTHLLFHAVVFFRAKLYLCIKILQFYFLHYFLMWLYDWKGLLLVRYLVGVRYLRRMMVLIVDLRVKIHFLLSCFILHVPLVNFYCFSNWCWLSLALGELSLQGYQIMTILFWDGEKGEEKEGNKVF